LGDLIITGDSVGTASGTTENFVRIGHSFLAVIAAISGGLLSDTFRPGIGREPCDRPTQRTDLNPLSISLD